MGVTATALLTVGVCVFVGVSTIVSVSDGVMVNVAVVVADEIYRDWETVGGIVTGKQIGRAHV